MTAFTHLRTHSYYSLLSASDAPDALAERARADGHSHLALTDDSLIGAVRFARACRSVGIEPITGLTVRLAERARPEDPPAELVLLAKGPSGYRSLCRLSSAMQRGATHPRTGQPLLALAQAEANAGGLFCIDGGRRGLVAGALRHDDAETALHFAHRLRAVFGEAFFLAVAPQSEGHASDPAQIVALADRLGVGAVALQPIYCLDARAQDRLRLLAAIDLNCRLEDVPSSRLPEVEAHSVHWPEPAEFVRCYAAYPQALAATLDIAQACVPALPDGRPIWPIPKLPAGQSADDRLAELAESGLQTRYAESDRAAARRRMRTELEAIARHGFAPVFLIVADVVGFARDEEIPVSTRGSVANSLTAYCIGVTTVDPLAHGLLFERFLNPARRSLPDIDLDFCSRRRDEVLRYLRATYGSDRMALVATISTMRPKSALRETAKAYGIGKQTLAALSTRLSADRHPDPQRRRRFDPERFIAETADRSLHAMLRAAFELVGQPHHLSIHPGGVVVTPGPLTDYVPLQWAPKGFMTTQYEHGDVEAIGLPKIDLLGIRALTVLADAAELVRRHHAADFKLNAIPLDDAATGALLARGETIGVFQCESTGAQRTLRQLQARTVHDLAVANAFFKPGPATGGMADAFVRRYRGQEAARYLHPALEPILAATHGVLIFQEQVLRIAVEVAGLTWGEAEHLRKGMSKFQPHEMNEIRARFIAGCLRSPPDGSGLEPKQADTLWQQIFAFAGYGFNQGHATAYADVSYRSAYLKTHWPATFLCARLADWGGFHHQAIYIAEARRLGIAVRPPHVNHSERRFTLTWEGEQPVLWMGLGQVRSLRRVSQRALVEARGAGPFVDLRDLNARLDLQPREATNLIRCGALDGLGVSRAAQLAEAEAIRRAGNSAQLALPFAQLDTPTEKLAERLAWEREILGLPVSDSPAALCAAPDGALTFAHAASSPAQTVEVAAVRLPGWTGGKGYFLSDGQTFVTAAADERTMRPQPWAPLLVRGRWVEDDRLGSRFRVEQLAFCG